MKYIKEYTVKYQSDDGQIFDDEESCKAYEKEHYMSALKEIQSHVGDYFIDEDECKVMHIVRIIMPEDDVDDAEPMIESKNFDFFSGIMHISASTSVETVRDFMSWMTVYNYHRIPKYEVQPFVEMKLNELKDWILG